MNGRPDSLPMQNTIRYAAKSGMRTECPTGQRATIGTTRRYSKKMTLTNGNYYTTEANKTFWSVSMFKAFDKCEASGLAQCRGLYKREMTDALLIGSYVDAYFSGEMDEFLGKYSDIMYTQKGELYAKYAHANRMINAVECQPLMMEYLEGEKQVVRTGKLFGVDWKIKMDVCNGERIVDFKTVKDFEPLYKEGFGKLNWIEYWGYDIQGAIYQKVEQISSGRSKPLPFYIVAVTKEKVPDKAVIQIPQSVLDTALSVVEAKIDRFDLVKLGEIEPEGCGKCEFCKSTKVLTEPIVYESEV